MNKKLQEQLEEIQNPVLKEHLSTMIHKEFEKKKIRGRVNLRTLPTAITPNLTVYTKENKKQYTIIGKYGQGFIIKDDAGQKKEVFYEWFERGKPLI